MAKVANHIIPAVAIQVKESMNKEVKEVTEVLRAYDDSFFTFRNFVNGCYLEKKSRKGRGKHKSIFICLTDNIVLIGTKKILHGIY